MYGETGQLPIILLCPWSLPNHITWLYIDVIPGERPGKSSNDITICVGHKAVDAHAQYRFQAVMRRT